MAARCLVGLAVGIASASPSVAPPTASPSPTPEPKRERERQPQRRGDGPGEHRRPGERRGRIGVPGPVDRAQPAHRLRDDRRGRDLGVDRRVVLLHIRGQPGHAGGTRRCGPHVLWYVSGNDGSILDRVAMTATASSAPSRRRAASSPAPRSRSAGRVRRPQDYVTIVPKGAKRWTDERLLLYERRQPGQARRPDQGRRLSAVVRDGPAEQGQGPRTSP